MSSQPVSPLLATLLPSLSSWGTLKSAERTARRESHLAPAWQQARDAGEALDFLRALAPSWSNQDVAFFHQTAVASFDLAAAQAVETAFPPEGELRLLAPYPGSGLSPLPFLMSSDEAARVCADPQHPSRASFDALFDDLLQWSVDSGWLDTPLVADDEEPQAELWTERLGDTQDFRPLHFAARFGRLDLIQRILAAGAHPDGCAPEQADALPSEKAPAKRGSPLRQALIAKRLDCSEALLDAGADPTFSVTHSDGEHDIETASEPLEIPLSASWREGVELLLQRGATLLTISSDVLDRLKSRKPLDPLAADPFFIPRLRSQLLSEELLSDSDTIDSVERIASSSSSPPPDHWAPPTRLFQRVAMGWALILGRPINLASGRLAPDPAPAAWAAARRALIQANAPVLAAALESAASDAKPADHNLAWMAFHLASASGQSRDAPARLECLRALALASERLPSLRRDFHQRSPEAAGMGMEAAAASFGRLGVIAAMGELFDELTALDRPGSADFSALSLASLSGEPERVSALVRSRGKAGLTHPPLLAADPGPLAWALKRSDFTIAQELSALLTPFPEAAIDRARNETPLDSNHEARRLALIERCALEASQTVIEALSLPKPSRSRL